MSYESYEEFSDGMTDILSSGSPFELSDWHEKSIAELIEGMDRDSVVQFLNMWYAGEDPEELREGELSYIAEAVSNLDVNSVPITAGFRITFC